MSDEQRRDSLADQAAAWIPPWERPRQPAPTPEAVESPGTPETVESPGTPEPDASPEAVESHEVAESSSAPEVLQSPGTPEAVGSPGVGEPDERGEERATNRPEPASVTAPSVGPEDLGSKPPLQGPNSSKISGEPGAGEPGGELGAGELGGGRGVPRRDGLAGRRRVTTVTQPAPELSDAELRGALEAILLVVDEPVSELVLAQVLEQPAERIGPMLDEIAAGYTAAGHGFELRRAAGGWRLYTRPEYATYVERFVLDGQSVRLTQAALETLAVVAYKQPVTRSRISAIRGVNCDGVIRTLVTRGLVEECGTEPDSGAFLYRTTTLFLEKLGLNTVDELPPLAPFLPDDVEELADATR
ncbi:SMC-Scp complex subunit ScpB [Micromonospora profundi]|uniref:SMC-Scp complex subunit ScpB n=1 Tax=Micromonospora profundi TaxID=1420889 RepID=A0AAJ6HRG3_9ACTN|nr:SMC-Scp complex subunit ScpB [Micromonospora profundi]WLS44832.1 SMC-Scp complex subunit ScpB [Micromonospora profundi]